MKKIELFVFYSVALVIITVLATLLVIVAVQKQAQSNVSSEVVIDRIKNQSFLVTKTVYTDQQTEIKIDQGSAWSNFFWGKDIVAKARIRTDYGLDLQKLTPNNITVDQKNKVMTIHDIEPSILNSSINSDLNIENNGSILRKLFASDPNGDYVLAQSQLLDSTNKAINNDQSLKDDTKSSTSQQLTNIFKDVGYTVQWK